MTLQDEISKLRAFVQELELDRRHEVTARPTRPTLRLVVDDRTPAEGRPPDVRPLFGSESEE